MGEKRAEKCSFLRLKKGQNIDDIGGITRRSVQVLYNQGRIGDAKKIGKVWIIPSNAKKPDYKRLKKNGGSNLQYVQEVLDGQKQ